MRRLHRSDSTQKAIVEGLRAAGAQVWPIGRPLDLLVAWRGRTMLVECKPPKGKPRTPAQIKFLAEWRGEVHIAESAEQAISSITHMKS